MTITTLSNTIAKAILATIERDGICNLGNIEETVFRELAVAQAKQSFPAGMTTGDEIRRCAQELVDQMLADSKKLPAYQYGADTAYAHHKLSEAPRK